MRKTPVVAFVVLMCASACLANYSLNIRRCSPARISIELPDDGIGQMSEDQVVWPTVTRAMCAAQNSESAGKTCSTRQLAEFEVPQFEVDCDDVCGLQLTLPVTTRSVRTLVCVP